MTSLSFEYWNKLASQLIVISSLLGGFSLSVIVPLIGSETTTKIANYIFRSVVIATASFLVAIFAMTRILMLTSQGFPFKVTENDLTLPRILGCLTFFIGILAILVFLTLSGWSKSIALKRFSTIVGIVTLLLILAMLV